MSGSPKGLMILGSTGSVGTAALDVVRHHAGRFRVVCLGAGKRLRELEDQCREFRPELAVIAQPDGVDGLADAERRLAEMGVRLAVGPDAAAVAARESSYDTLVGAVTGAAGLAANLAAVRRGKRLAIANKESLVVAGQLLTAIARESGSDLLPVDSEHSAVWQCLRGETTREVRRIILTASGGPFRTFTAEQLSRVTLEQALKHPTWTMGPKITVDSSTLFNKALELIEARWLFGTSPGQLDVVVHPQSIVHSMVEFTDRSVMAQLGNPDMRIPIQLALSAPERWEAAVQPMDFSTALALTFEPLDHSRFPAVGLGFEVARAGGTTGAVFNAANEVAVARFLNRELNWGDIYRTVDATLAAHTRGDGSTLEELLAADAWAREHAARVIK